ncbi:MAG: glycosyltransferase family protein [Anaerolineales bacterium]|jgi:spore coat polysaccharide biosynthesis protein SpsF
MSEDNDHKSRLTPHTSHKTIAIIQARMASSRLPGKVLLDIAGQPMLVRVVERSGKAKTLDGVVVATTIDPSDDAIAELCAERGYSYYRGSAYDVLDRYFQAACAFRAGVVVRITADCPVIDPGLIDQAVVELNQSGADFVANRLPPPWHRTYPIGLDLEVCTFHALERAWREGDQPHQREHVMPYLYEKEGRFQAIQIDHDPDYGHLRWTVDTREDLELIRRVYEHFNGRDDFSWLEVLNLFRDEPGLAQINASVHHKTAYDVDERPEA